ncbi:MAG: CoA pyrophosphatase [Pseudomonadota bacterium]|nr:MAG: CoA pyrophosphatase [Pseudomonadota bacterium]
MLSRASGVIPDVWLPDGWLARLHPLDAVPDELPVRGYRPRAGVWNTRPAAVLIPLLLEPSARVVLTVRSQRLAHHAGQVALPGGGRQHGEAFPLATALREAHEEIGVDPAVVRPCGLLDCFDTITGYRIVPVVATIEGRQSLRPCPDEVARIFTLPWATVRNPASYRHHRVCRAGHSYDMVSMSHSRWPIWGATAAILEQFALSGG